MLFTVSKRKFMLSLATFWWDAKLAQVLCYKMELSFPVETSMTKCHYERNIEILELFDIEHLKIKISIILYRIIIWDYIYFNLFFPILSQRIILENSKFQAFLPASSLFKDLFQCLQTLNLLWDPNNVHHFYRFLSFLW